MSSEADKPACDATLGEELRRQIMDSRVPKNEREWWAAREIERLERWKSEQLLVESKWDPQRVAQLLGIGLGQDIRPNIEPKIVALLRLLEEQQAQIDRLKDGISDQE